MENNFDVKTEVEMINSIVREAIKHGGDAGGSYFSNSSKLKKQMQYWINFHELQDTHILVLLDDGFPIIAEKF